PHGALDAEVVPGAPAALAGLQPGDVVLGFNGHPIQKHTDLMWLASTGGVGARAGLKIIRQGKELELAITLASHPSDGNVIPASGTAPAPKLGRVSGLGLTLTDVSARVREELGLDSTEG